MKHIITLFLIAGYSLLNAQIQLPESSTPNNHKAAKGGFIIHHDVQSENKTHAGYFRNINTAFNFSFGIDAIAEVDNNFFGTAYGVRGAGYNLGTAGSAYGGFFNAESSDPNVSSIAVNADAKGDGDSYGVYATASAPFGTTRPGKQKKGSNTNYGIYAAANDASTNWAGYFADGNVHIENNLGIGVTTPIYKLHINNAGDNTNAIQADDVSGEISTSGVRGTSNTVDWNGFGVFGTGGWRGVFGTVNPTGFNDYQGVRGEVSGGSGDNYGVYGLASGGNIAYGVYGAGSAATTNYAGFFAGNVSVTGVFSNPSDKRLKEDIKHSKSKILHHINRLQVKYYSYRTDDFKDMNLPTEPQMGFIAQEVQTVFPRLVNKNIHASQHIADDGSRTSEKIEYLGINYIGLIPVLTKGIQELTDQNKYLQAANDQLQSANEQLVQRLEMLEAKVNQLLPTK